MLLCEAVVWDGSTPWHSTPSVLLRCIVFAAAQREVAVPHGGGRHDEKVDGVVMQNKKMRLMKETANVSSSAKALAKLESGWR